MSFIVSLNLVRRHLSESQRAMVAAKIASLPKGANQHASIDAPSQADAAEMLNISRMSVQRARKVRESGDTKLIAAVESGEVTVSAAAQHVAASITPTCAGLLPKQKRRACEDSPLRFSRRHDDSSPRRDIFRPFVFSTHRRVRQVINLPLNLEPRRFILRLIQPVELRP